LWLDCRVPRWRGVFAAEDADGLRVDAQLLDPVTTISNGIGRNDLQSDLALPSRSNLSLVRPNIFFCRLFCSKYIQSILLMYVVSLLPENTSAFGCDTNSAASRRKEVVFVTGQRQFRSDATSAVK
jgi:hypothetical protein